MTMDDMRTTLLADHQRLQRRLNETEAVIRTGHPRESDPIDLAADREDDEILVAMDRADMTHLRRVDAALQRLTDGNFGCCARCGGRIAEARLLAVPETDSCKECADGRRAS